VTVEAKAEDGPVGRRPQVEAGHPPLGLGRGLDGSRPRHRPGGHLTADGRPTDWHEQFSYGRTGDVLPAIADDATSSWAAAPLLRFVFDLHHRGESLFLAGKGGQSTGALTCTFANRAWSGGVRLDH
jgi:hypothetical protein